MEAAAWSKWYGRWRRSIRGRLILLTLALLLPAVVVASALLWRSYDQEHQASEVQLSDTVRALSLVMDRQIGQSRILLEALSTSQPLYAGQFAAFDAQARAANDDPDRWVIVTDAGGHRLVDTLGLAKPASQPGPDTQDPGFTALPGGARLSNLRMGAPGTEPVVVVSKTVRLADGRNVELTVAMAATIFRSIFTEQQIPDRWVGTVFDASNTIVARTRGGSQFIGHHLSAKGRHRLADRAQAVVASRTLDGQPSVLAWQRSPSTHWTMLVAVPPGELAAGARASALVGGLLGLTLLGLGLALSYQLGRSVAGPVERLAAAADALGRGEEVSIASTPITEAEAVHTALRQAGEALRQRERDLQALNQTLERRVIERTRELAEATESLIQARKMEAVGRLTGGIAHDFNNLLTAVLGNLELIERRTSDERTVRQLGAARSAAERGAKLTGQLLAFSRRQQLVAETVDVNLAVENTVGLLQSTLGGAITVSRSLAPALWMASADPTQLDLILLNLAINARDAMPTGGSILIETGNVTLDASPRAEEEPGAGDYVAITVADRGTGMPPEILARVFEPFFTTKPVGQGTGLGLPQVLGVLKQLGGGIRIVSRPGDGTGVTIFLPRSSSTALAPPDEAVTVHDLRGMRILLVDDDPDVRGVAAAMLREQGCHVTEASGGREGRDLLVAEAIDFVLLDFAMPGLNGAETAAAMRVIRPELPILLMSGFADVDALASLWSGPLLPKPFTVTALTNRIAETARTHRVTRFRAVRDS